MKKLVATTLGLVFAAGGLMITSTDADAGGRHWRGGARVGIYLGAPVVASPWWYGPRSYHGYGPYPYYPNYPYYAPVVREEPTVYIEQTPSEPAAPAPQAQAQQQYWYYCRDTQTYYPHVQNCASPWQRVVPHAPQ